MESSTWHASGLAPNSRRLVPHSIRTVPTAAVFHWLRPSVLSIYTHKSKDFFHQSLGSSILFLFNFLSGEFVSHSI